MPVKVTGSRTPEQVEKHLQKNHRVLSMSPQQINDFVDGKVTDLDSNRAMFKLILRLIKANTERN